MSSQVKRGRKMVVRDMRDDMRMEAEAGVM